MKAHYDVIVIGGGIVGLAHAWMAARRNLSVLLLERTSVAEGASVRNFGMIWPIGQPSGELYSLALRSRDFWMELKRRGVLQVDDCSSVHVAHHPDELAVLEEFCELGSHQCSMITADEVLRQSPIVNPQGLLGGMLSPTELRVDPRTASARMAAWLSEGGSVDCCFKTTVTRVCEGTVHASDGRNWSAERIIVCSGSDLQTLYPEILQNSGLKLCKLQMLKTHCPLVQGRPVQDSPALHIASGLTLRHYKSFTACPSLVRLSSRIASESPELDHYGIHVMASHFADGGLILGDSHEYDAEITPFNNEEIDELMLRELRKILQLDDWTIRERWHGIYAKHPTLPVFEASAEGGVQIFVGPGGAGMTMSFGLADRAWKLWTGENK